MISAILLLNSLLEVALYWVTSMIWGRQEQGPAPRAALPTGPGPALRVVHALPTDPDWLKNFTCSWVKEGKLTTAGFPEDMPPSMRLYLAAILPVQWPAALKMIMNEQDHTFIGDTSISFSRNWSSDSEDSLGSENCDDSVAFCAGPFPLAEVPTYQFLRVVQIALKERPPGFLTSKKDLLLVEQFNEHVDEVCRLPVITAEPEGINNDMRTADVAHVDDIEQDIETVCQSYRIKVDDQFAETMHHLDRLSRLQDLKRSEPKMCLPISNVRQPENGFFESCDCKNIIRKLNEVINLIVCGDHGTGKTQGVLAYAKMFAQKNANAVMWFFGQSGNKEKGLSEKTIIEQGKYLAERLCVSHVSNEVLANNIMASLHSRQSNSLLIFDDVTDPNAIPPAYLSLTVRDKVKVIITTRSTNLDLNLPNYDMMGFEEKDVLHFLRREDQTCLFQGTSEEDLLKLGKVFGNFPHGLSLARGYLLKSMTSVGSYLRELQKRSKDIPGQLKMHEKAIYCAILMSMEDRMDRASQDMFKFAAILSQDSIPVSILSKALEIDCGENPDKDDFLKEVEELSLARVEGKKEDCIDGRMISVHEQTQAAILSNLDERQLQTMTEALIKVFLQYFHKDTRKVQDGHISSLLLPHVEAVLSLSVIRKLPEKFHAGLARLYETVGYMYCQKHLPEVAVPALEKAKEIMSTLVSMDGDEDSVFQSLVEKGRELYDKGDVYNKGLNTRLLTKGQVEILKTKVPTLSEDFSKAAKMGQPLTEEQHQHLVELGVAYNTEHIQDSFLVELAATVLYTSGRRIFHLQGEQRVCYRQTAEKELNLSLALSQKLATDKGIQILNKMLCKRAGTLYLLKETEGKTTSQQKEDFHQAIQGYQELIYDDNDYFENGILKKIGDDDFHWIFCYRAIVDSYRRLISLATTDQERADFIQRYDESAKKMVELAEQQIKKGAEGNVTEEPEMLPEVYNMSGEFIVDVMIVEMSEKGCMEISANDLFSAIIWYEKALGVNSVKPYHEAASRLGLAKVYTLVYEAEVAKSATSGNNLTPFTYEGVLSEQETSLGLGSNEETLWTRGIQEVQKWNRRIVCYIDSLSASTETINGKLLIATHDKDEKVVIPELDKIDHLLKAKRHMNKSMIIFEEFVTRHIEESTEWQKSIIMPQRLLYGRKTKWV